ncbi:MAG: glycerate dehydrogenase, partial [Pseudomonadales bacterium]|nr:glycerate dehydrogenase [Pseudomonadales bacterium]
VAQAFGMEVLVSRKIGEPDDTPGRIPFEDLVQQVDYLSLHCPLTAATDKMIDAGTLSRMKPGAFLINTARGGLVDPPALIDALRTGTIAGAAIDVLDREPPADDEALLDTGLDNLIVTPHNAWGAIESRRRLVDQMRENIESWLEDRPVRVVT